MSAPRHGHIGVMRCDSHHNVHTRAASRCWWLVRVTADGETYSAGPYRTMHEARLHEAKLRAGLARQDENR